MPAIGMYIIDACVRVCVWRQPCCLRAWRANIFPLPLCISRFMQHFAATLPMSPHINYIKLFAFNCMLSLLLSLSLCRLLACKHVNAAHCKLIRTYVCVCVCVFDEVALINCYCSARLSSARAAVAHPVIELSLPSPGC